MSNELVWVVIGEIILLLLALLGYLISREVKRRDDVAKSVQALSERLDKFERERGRR
jgi:hypothetical protein